MSNTRIPTRISPDLLDTIGRSFRFRHGKGVAEWLKNSLDSYRRLHAAGEEPLPGGWPVIIHLVNGANRSSGPHLAVVDFGGTTYEAVDSFFLHWGDTSAATHGGTTSVAGLTGGHGNGGKFYMREMWRDGARFLTWRNERLTSLIVDKKEKDTTGYWEWQAEHFPDWRQALNAAFPTSEGLLGGHWLVEYLSKHQSDIVEQLDLGIRGLTVLIGRTGRQVLSSNDVVRGRRWDHQKLIEEIRDAAQARRPIRELSVSVFIDGALRIERLEPEMFELDPAWADKAIEVPGSCIGKEIQRIGILRIAKSLHQLTGRKKHHNALWVVDSHDNPIAHYTMNELPLAAAPTIRPFLHGELELAFEGIEEFIENDREHLVASPSTQSLLEWVASEIDRFAVSIHEAQLSTLRSNELRLAAILNEHLNEHAQRFLEKLQSEMLVDFVDDPTGGGPGPQGTGTGKREGPGQRNGIGGSGGTEGSGGTRATEGTEDRMRRPQFPEVLLSGYDPDPSQNNEQTKVLTEHHPPLYQDDTDRQFNVWWINTAHTFARQALDRGGAEGAQFKSYQLFMFRDVVQRESLRILQRREAEIALDQAESILDDYSDRFLGDLPVDLLDELLK